MTIQETICLSCSPYYGCWCPDDARKQCISSHGTDGPIHYSDVIMSTMTSQITGTSIVCSTSCSAADQRKHQRSASLAFVRRILWWPVDSPYKGPVMWKMFPYDDIIMTRQEICLSYCPYHACWCPGDARKPCISSHGTDGPISTRIFQFQHQRS